MKKITLFLLLASALLSCKENSSPVTSKAVQYDTLKTNKLLGEQKDSVITNGEYVQFYKNGVIKMRGMMKDGKRDGLWKSFYENGSPWSETTFKDGKKEGKTTTWYENEKKRYEGYYKEDTESGKWIFWDEKGNQVSEKTY